MKIEEIFEIPISDKIEAVIKVAEKGDETKLAAEIGSYVVTPLIEKILDEFLDHYTDSFRKDTTEVGVWISGYFGSGKSHLAKIMGLLSENQIIKGVTACERFESRITTGSNYRDSIIRSLKLMNQCDTEVLAFNLNTIQDAKKHDLAHLLLSQFYWSRGYCTNLTYARVIEAEVDRSGKLDDLHQLVETLSGKKWDDIRKNPTFFLKYFYEAACTLLPENFPNADSLKESLQRAEREELVNVAFLVQECLAYLKRKELQHPGQPQRLLWVLDETGQWIEANKGRLSAVQAFIEELAIKGQGKIMAIVTTHGDMGAIYAEARALDTEMKKIAGRFWIKPTLTTENIELVLEERLLKKNHGGEKLLADVYSRRGGVLRSIGELANTNQKLPDCSDTSFIKYYPFFPYQIHLIPEIVKSIRSKGGHGEQMSGSTRTLLGIVHGILNAGRRPYLHSEVRPMVSFDEFYYNLEGSEISPDVKSDIMRIVSKTGGSELTRQVAEVLYLVRELPYIPRSLGNISRLLASDIEEDLPQIEARVEQELAVLQDAKLVAKSGDEYEYLTGEKRSFEEEVASLMTMDPTDKEKGLTKYFVKGDGKEPYVEWLGIATLEYLGNRFPFTLIIDHTPVTGTSGSVTLDLITPYGRVAQKEDSIVQNSLTSQNTLFVVSGRVQELEQNLTRYLAMKTVAENWRGDSSKSEEARKLAREREENDLKKLRRAVMDDLATGLAGGTLIFRGAKIPIPQKTGMKPGDALRSLCGDQLKSIYTQYDRVAVRVKDDQKAIRDVVSGKGASNADVRDLNVYDIGSSTLNEHAALLSEVSGYLRSEYMQGRKVTGKALMKQFEEPPYGWDSNAIRVAVAALVREGRIEISIGNRPFRNLDDPELLEVLRIKTKFDSSSIAPAGEVDTADVTTARKFLIQLTKKKNIDETAPAIYAAFDEIYQSVTSLAEPVKIWASGSGLPIPMTFSEGLIAFDDVFSITIPSQRVIEIVKNQDLLSQGYKAVHEYATFHTKHGATFVDLKEFVQTLEGILHYATEKPEIEECVSRYKEATQSRNVADPTVWSGLIDGKNKADLALRELIVEWKEKARDAAFDVRTTVLKKAADYHIEEEFAETLLTDLGRCSKTIDDETHPVTLANLSVKISNLLSGILNKLENEYKRRNPDPVPSVKDKKVEKIKISEFIGGKKITSENDWNVISSDLDKRVRYLLGIDFEVELE